MIEGELLAWKNSGHRKPLVLRGARHDQLEPVVQSVLVLPVQENCWASAGKGANKASASRIAGTRLAREAPLTKRNGLLIFPVRKSNRKRCAPKRRRCS